MIIETKKMLVRPTPTGWHYLGDRIYSTMQEHSAQSLSRIFSIGDHCEKNEVFPVLPLTD